MEPTFSSWPNVIQKQHYKLITFEVLGSRDITITPYLQLLSSTYDDEWTNIDAKIEYECNIAKYVSKPTKTNNKIRFLLHPDLNSTCNYQSPNGLILGVSIKAHLVNLGDATFDHLNYLGLHMPFYHKKGILLTSALYLIASVNLCITKEWYIFVTSSKKIA